MKIKEKIKFKTNLKKLLDERNISPHQLSVKTNINKSSLHNYLNGVLPQGLIALVKLSDLFKISLDELVFKKTEVQIPTVQDTQTDETYVITIKKITK